MKEEEVSSGLLSDGSSCFKVTLSSVSSQTSVQSPPLQTPSSLHRDRATYFAVTFGPSGLQVSSQ